MPVSPKHTWKRLHQITTGIPDWQDYLNAVEVYADKASEEPKRRRAKRGRKRRKSEARD